MSLRASILLLLLLPTLVVGQELASLSPQAGLLVLRNGQLMHGEITRAGDYYIVTIGVGGEVKIAASDVETQCANIEAAYDWKLRRLSGEGAAPHLDLAEWCLRNNLHRHCAEQLSLALATEPNHKRIEQIDRRLQLALQDPSPPKSAHREIAFAGPEQLDAMLRDLPKGSLERFTTLVQPMLNNRCATNRCHGGSSTAEMQLMRPPNGVGSPQRFTHRNLYAVLKFVNRDDPANSPLLLKPQEAHGGATAAMFDARSKSQLHELEVWIDQLANRKEITQPTTIDAQNAQLSTPLRTPSNQEGAATAAENQTAQAPAKHSAGNETSVKKPALPTPLKPTGNTPWKPRDAMDPEIFNRRHATKR